MLFKTRFHPGIRDGRITLTFRAWQSARVTAGKRYNVAPIGMIEVVSLDTVAITEITADDASASGFESAEELVDTIRTTSTRRLTARSKVYRVAFCYVGRPPVRAEPDGSPEALEALRARLEKMDRRSHHGPWTRTVLELIAESPRVAAAKLAARVDRDTRRFKVDVRKLKKIGLTRSLEVGYELSPLGRELVRVLRA